MVTVEVVTENFGLGEGPHWDILSQSLYFVDIVNKSIVKYTPSTKKTTKATLEKPASFIIPIEGRKNAFIVSQDNELAVISWDSETNNATIVQKLCVIENPKKFNDAKCDSKGRLWAGCHDIAKNFRETKPVGVLYSLEGIQSLESKVENINLSNGLAFNDKAKKMFYIDTLDKIVYSFDFDINSGSVSNKQAWFTFEKNNVPGFPDGMTIDTDGNLWVAGMLGRRIIKVDGHKPETLLDTINLPAEQVTSVAFGGPHLDELYVTSGDMEFEGKKPTPSTKGATYKITGTGSQGLPASNFKLNFN